ncbi:MULTISPECIES: hypothetical protein [Rhizobium]|uniref:hypothetical protein n=1 Tax=Rhizobium TaxID=379 RepID=UPI0004628710|nr:MULTISPECIES: hypothetical protein [Rhizobium]UFS81521.1 hypothetical protein LPB79_24940 [Rhizobium sp. T136]
MSKIPVGWLDLVTELRVMLELAYPTVTVSEMSADRGWLHVRVDDSALAPTGRQILDRRIQGYVTKSLSTCMCCGSGSGRDRADRRVVTCDECEKESCDA